MIKEKKLFTVEKAVRLLFILVFLLSLYPPAKPANANSGVKTDEAAGNDQTKLYLPFIRHGLRSDLPLMAGVAPHGWPEQSTIDNIMRPLDSWVTGVTGGRSTSIFGTFLPLDLTDAIAKPNVEDPLTVVWNAGYTPFVNLPALSGDTALVVATSDKYEKLITTWAKSFKNYANNGKRFAYIAPLQEMNGEWVTYGGDPVNFIRAYKRFQTIFAREGVPEQSVKWVFAPNAWTNPKYPPFEAYYPGDDFVDVVAFSAYNFGYCANGSIWEEPEVVFNNPNYSDGHYLDRLRALAPSKSIFIAQTAVSPYRYSGVVSDAEKNRWLRDAYAYLSDQPGVRAVIYFNIFEPYRVKCSWPFYSPDGAKYDGYRTGVNSNGYTYISPAALMATDHSLR